MFWAIADIYQDLVGRRHVQVRLMCNFGLNGGIPGWRKPMVLSVSLAEKITKHFVISFLTVSPSSQILTHYCLTFKPNFDSLWSNLLLKVSNLNATDGTQISQFITNLDRFHKMLLLLGCLHPPFDNATVTSINKFIASATAKIYKIRTEKLRELEAPWLLK